MNNSDSPIKHDECVQVPIWGGHVDAHNHEGEKGAFLFPGEVKPGTEVVRQIVYRYPAGDSGSGQFAVWHLGASVVTVYGPEGNKLRTLRLSTARRTDADVAAWAHGEVMSETESSNLYPAGKPVIHVRNDSANGRKVELAQRKMADYNTRGYSVCSVPADGREHPYDRVCPVCTPADN